MMTVLSLRPTFLRLVYVGVLIAALLPVLPTVAHAQSPDIQALLDRINRLERDIRTLNRQIANIPAVPQTTTEAPTTLEPAASAKATATPTPKIEYNEGEGTASRVMVRVGALEQEVRNATGLAESMAHNIDLANARLDKLVVDLDYRLSRLEGTAPGSLQSSVNSVPGMPAVSAAPSTSSVSTIAGAPLPTKAAPDYARAKPSGTSGILGTMEKSSLDKIVSEGEQATSDVEPEAKLETKTAVASKATVEPAVEAKPEISVQDQYDVAFNLTRQARYQEAEIAFKDFVETNGDDPLAGNALYWLGETYYVRKDFNQAAQTFYQAYKKFPKGPKAPDSLLKLGMSMAGMEKTKPACSTFGKLSKEFGADLRPNIKRMLNKETKRLACP